MFKSNLIMLRDSIMSLQSIKEKLIESIKQELYTEENKQFFEDEFLKPMITQILDQMYPYVLWTATFFMAMFLFVMIILILNIRILLST